MNMTVSVSCVPHTRISWWTCLRQHFPAEILHRLLPKWLCARPPAPTTVWPGPHHWGQRAGISPLPKTQTARRDQRPPVTRLL